jgi:hypothetical protein
MAADKVRRGHFARLSAWNRLFHGLPVNPDELDLNLLCGDPSSTDERAAYVTLRACAVLAQSGRQAVRSALRIAILYWFSNIGEHRGAARDPLEPKRTAFHLAEAIGTGLTWDEAVATMKRKPIDFAGYLAVLERVEQEYARQWDLVFPRTERAPISALRGALRDNDYARQWNARRDNHSGRPPHADRR